LTVEVEFGGKYNLNAKKAFFIIVTLMKIMFYNQSYQGNMGPAVVSSETIIDSFMLCELLVQWLSYCELIV